jgi:iron(III) transport system permease protein
LRSRHRFRFVFDYIAFLPLAVPSIVFGLAALVVALFVIRGPIDLYGSLVLLIITSATVQISFGTRFTNAALVQIHPELEEAAQVSGASTFGVLRHVVLPLLLPAILNAWLWLALLSFRELTLATMLFSSENMTLSVAVWNVWSSGKIGTASSVSILMLGLLLPLVIVYWRFGRARAVL